MQLPWTHLATIIIIAKRKYLDYASGCPSPLSESTAGIKMLEVLSKIVAWVSALWNKIPDSQKEKIILLVVTGFEELFRAFFQSAKKESKT